MYPFRFGFCYIKGDLSLQASYKVKCQKTEKRPWNPCVLKYFKYKTFSIFDIAFEACNGVKVAHNIAQSTSHFTASEVFCER